MLKIITAFFCVLCFLLGQVEILEAGFFDDYFNLLGKNIKDEYQNNPHFNDVYPYSEFFDMIDNPSENNNFYDVPPLFKNAFNRTNSKVINEFRVVKRIKVLAKRLFSYNFDFEINNEKTVIYSKQPQADLSYRAVFADKGDFRANIGLKISPQINIGSEDILLIQPYFRINLRAIKNETTLNLLGRELKSQFLYGRNKFSICYLKEIKNQGRELVYFEKNQIISKSVNVKMLGEYNLNDFSKKVSVIIYLPFYFLR